MFSSHIFFENDFSLNAIYAGKSYVITKGCPLSYFESRDNSEILKEFSESEEFNQELLLLDPSQIEIQVLINNVNADFEINSCEMSAFLKLYDTDLFNNDEWDCYSETYVFDALFLTALNTNYSQKSLNSQNLVICDFGEFVDGIKRLLDIFQDEQKTFFGLVGEYNIENTFLNLREEWANHYLEELKNSVSPNLPHAVIEEIQKPLYKLVRAFNETDYILVNKSYSLDLTVVRAIKNDGQKHIIGYIQSSI